MRLAADQLGSQAADGAKLLAVSQVRRRLEPGAARGPRIAGLVAAMSAAGTPAAIAEKLLYLTELIAAIDRRIPQVERAGEPAIVNAAVRLRLEAENRIKEIERNLTDRPSVDGRPADSV